MFISFPAPPNELVQLVSLAAALRKDALSDEYV